MSAFLMLVLACGGGTDETGDTTASATLTFVDPIDGDSVPAGTLPVSVIVEGFLLVDPSKHNEGAPEGYLSVTLDEAEVLQTSSTVFEVELAAPGTVVLGAELFYADGDPLEPPVRAEVMLEVTDPT